MAEPTDRLWQALLALAEAPSNQAFAWQSRSGDAALSRPLSDVASLNGGWSAADRRTFELFAPLLAQRRLVLAQLGQSLDGRIATSSGDSYYINGKGVRAHLHRLRALVDAVIIGVGTAQRDHPALTVRHCEGISPVPVLIDPNLRVAPSGPLFDPDQTARLIIVHGNQAQRTSWPDHVERIALPNSTGSTATELSPQAIVDALAARGLERVLVEGGGLTVSRFIDRGALDHLHLLIAPLLIGSGQTGIRLQPIERLRDVPRRSMQSYTLDEELIVDIDFRATR